MKNAKRVKEIFALHYLVIPHPTCGEIPNCTSHLIAAHILMSLLANSMVLPYENPKNIDAGATKVQKWNLNNSVSMVNCNPLRTGCTIPRRVRTQFYGHVTFMRTYVHTFPRTQPRDLWVHKKWASRGIILAF